MKFITLATIFGAFSSALGSAPFIGGSTTSEVVMVENTDTKGWYPGDGELALHISQAGGINDGGVTDALAALFQKSSTTSSLLYPYPSTYATEPPTSSRSDSGPTPTPSVPAANPSLNDSNSGFNSPSPAPPRNPLPTSNPEYNPSEAAVGRPPSAYGQPLDAIPSAGSPTPIITPPQPSGESTSYLDILSQSIDAPPSSNATLSPSSAKTPEANGSPATPSDSADSSPSQNASEADKDEAASGDLISKIEPSASADSLSSSSSEDSNSSSSSSPPPSSSSSSSVVSGDTPSSSSSKSSSPVNGSINLTLLAVLGVASVLYL